MIPFHNIIAKLDTSQQSSIYTPSRTVRAQNKIVKREIIHVFCVQNCGLKHEMKMSRVKRNIMMMTYYMEYIEYHDDNVTMVGKCYQNAG